MVPSGCGEDNGEGDKERDRQRETGMSPAPK